MARLRHFVIRGTATSESYTAIGGGGSRENSAPSRSESRQARGMRLAREVRTAAQDVNTTPERAVEGIPFVPILIRGEHGVGLALESLNNRQIGMEVVAFRQDSDGYEQATVHVPRNKISTFASKFEEYANHDYINQRTSERSPRNQLLVESISEIRLAMLRNGDYWTDSGPLPEIDEVIWWEVWLRDNSESASLETGQAIPVEQIFREKATEHGIDTSNCQVRFPGVTVILARTSLNHWTSFPGLLRYLVEFRRASIVTREFLELLPHSQAELINDMIERTSFAESDKPAVCILDSGVNRGHPLLEQALNEEHNIAWNNQWNTADRHGHGTEMAGLALYGEDLKNHLISNAPIQLSHRLEAVKILPDEGVNSPPDYGPITFGSVELIESACPGSQRVICMAVTADDRNKWLPTLWSAAIDQMCAGGGNHSQRLMMISAGNHRGTLHPDEYPAINHTLSVEDPAQAWNAITVGAYTDKVMITDPDYADWNPIAPRGRLCPTSRTSCNWDEQQWPYKPDIVMEGGNYAYNPTSHVSGIDDLSLLTTRISRNGALLTSMNDTSAATALAARFGAIIQGEYPSLWPESIRGLIIHSSYWTREMLEEFPHELRHNRLRCYGYGVPNLEKARYCASNQATLIIQDHLQPFYMDENGEVRTKEMQLHELPWPVEFLESLGEQQVRMRVTLSYFIEPNPGRRGWNAKHRFQSHGLRFDVRRPLENMAMFKARLNRETWPVRNLKPYRSVPDDRNWILGEKHRTKGSVHSDWWCGTAAKLAASGQVSVYPVSGWWRERVRDGAYNKVARYSLIIDIESTDTEIPIYNAVESSIQNRADIMTII